MGLGSSKNAEEQKPVEEKPKIKCDGCEKEVASADELRPYIGKMYCDSCLSGIKDANRRTRNRLTVNLGHQSPVDENSTEQVEIKVGEKS